MERQNVTARSPQAEAVGYSRAVRVGKHVFVAGTAPIMADGSPPPPDAYAQAKRCLEIIVDALAEVGAAPEHVVRTRIYLVEPADIDAAGHAHGEIFRDVKPACTALAVKELLDPAWLLEIEAEALIP